MDPASAGQADCPPIFDIVNGFLNRCRGAWIVLDGLADHSHAIDASQINQIDYLAEIIPPHHREDARAFMQACR